MLSEYIAFGGFIVFGLRGTKIDVHKFLGAVVQYEEDFVYANTMIIASYFESIL